MNLFYLDSDPSASAQYHCDKHVVKMILEGLQLQNAALYRVNPEGWDRRPGWFSHPAAIWAATSRENYTWLCRHTVELCNEYLLRYKRHHVRDPLARFRLQNCRLPNHVIPEGEWTQPYQGVPNDCKQQSTAEAYRLYYNKYKWPFAVWNHSETPIWFNPIRELSRHE